LSAPVFKDSLGNWVCKDCKKSYNEFTDAMKCSKGHDNQVAPAPVFDKRGPRQVMVPGEISAKMELYQKFANAGDTLEVAKTLAMTIIEDYELVRSSEMVEKNRPGALTLNYAKIAVEAINTHNKNMYGSRSSNLNVNVDATKKTDLDALKDVLLGKNRNMQVIGENESFVEGEFVDGNEQSDERAETSFDKRETSGKFEEL
jgi:hypothetical protein